MTNELMQEVAARKEAEGNLRESESRYRTLFESNPLPLWVYELGTLRFLAVNDVACAKYGYTREEFLAMTLRDIRMPEDVARLEESGIRRHRTRDQGTIDVEIISHALTYNGREARFDCPLDVTKRLNVEAAVREGQSQFRLLVEQSIVGIYVSEKGRMTYVNPKLCEILGYSAEELRAMDIVKMFAGEDLAIVRDVMLRRKNGDRDSIAFKCRAVHADGRKIHLSIESKMITLGTADVAMGIVRDISPWMNAQAALRESDLRFRQLAENINEVFFLEDPETGRDLYVSPAYEKIWGRSCESHYANQSSWKDSVHPDDLASVLESVEQRRTTGNFDHEYRIVRPDGSVRWISARGFPIRNDAGVIYRIAGSARDITPRKVAQEEVLRLTATLERRVAERTAELETANLELESFDYSISHDLRAPLRHITGYSAALLADCAGKLDERSLEHLRRLHAAGEKMDRMVGDLMRLSTLTREGVHRERVDVGALAASVIEDLRRADPGRDVEVVIEPSITADADRGLLHIALENLLGNAWKFTSKRAGARIEVGRSAANPQALFVRDNGAGFDMAYADNLFAPFRRLHKESEFKGTGIGLATVHRIVRLHGGRAWAEGTLGQGATFHFTLSSAGALAP